MVEDMIKYLKIMNNNNHVLFGTLWLTGMESNDELFDNQVEN